ncbi:MAG: aminoacetone oxidase family FAD-binding enzyme [Eubacteriales bacterium]|nr:aminoacetone oxidase family FAD-binding enzyme [Eubacteriales bacterium]
MNTVAIIGAGASGMMAALTAAEDKKRRVILFERQQRPARKLLATGNGRCNLTNTLAAPENYHSEQEGFADTVLKAFTPQNTLDFFHALGLLTVEEYGGRVYPLSNSANSVADVLRFAIERAGIELRAPSLVREIRRNGKGYTVIADDGNTDADFVIVACGGAAGAKLGGVSDGYELLKGLGHKRTKLYPALVQLITAPEYPRALKGVRTDCALKLMSGNSILAESAGELQFTDNGISGPAAFDISRCASTTGEGTFISADFMRDYAEGTVLELLKNRCEALPTLESAQLFTGMLHNRLGRMVIKYANLPSNLTLSQLDDTQLETAAHACKDFRLKFIGTEGFDSAQVTAGGVKTTGFNPATLESWFNPGLFACGEVLDVDADCGGYNLQWAWASGRTAGRLGK